MLQRILEVYFADRTIRTNNARNFRYAYKFRHEWSGTARARLDANFGFNPRTLLERSDENLRTSPTPQLREFSV